MKYTIEGFSQKFAMTLKKEVTVGSKTVIKKIDCTDLVILRWFVDFYPNMKKIEVDGKQYAWLTHKKLLEDLPLIDISRKAFIERMQKLVEFDILTYQLIKEGGTFSLYGFGENYQNLINEGVSVQTDTGCPNESTGGVCSNGYGVVGQTGDKDNSIIDTSIKNKSIIDYKAIIDCYNETCVSFSKVTALSETRKKAIKARLNTYSIEDIKLVFEKAEASDFLKGRNNRNWQANFDWLMKDSNFAKVKDGNYDNTTATAYKEENNREETRQEREAREYKEQLKQFGII